MFDVVVVVFFSNGPFAPFPFAPRRPAATFWLTILKMHHRFIDTLLIQTCIVCSAILIKNIVLINSNVFAKYRYNIAYVETGFVT